MPTTGATVETTLHAEHGVPVALNVGDLLLGEGYRLLAGCGASAQVCAEIVRIAAAGHRELCLGQGAELSWMQQPVALTADQAIEIFRRKTSPAFQVALGIGAALAGARPRRRRSCATTATRWASRIRSATISTISSDTATADDCGFSAPSLLLALACDKAKASGRERVMTSWRGGASSDADRAGVSRAARRAWRRRSRARALLEAYKEQAIRTLPALQNASLKGLLRRVVGKVFRVEIKGWCSEFEARDAAGRQAGTHAAR